MKMFYTALVDEKYTNRVESLMLKLRIGLNDWDKTKAFDYNGERYVNYTILCTEDDYNYIINNLYA